MLYSSFLLSFSFFGGGWLLPILFLSLAFFRPSSITSYAFSAYLHVSSCPSFHCSTLSCYTSSSFYSFLMFIFGSTPVSSALLCFSVFYAQEERSFSFFIIFLTASSSFYTTSETTVASASPPSAISPSFFFPPSRLQPPTLRH